MTDEQKMMAYEERIKSWEVHGMLSHRNQNIRDYINEKLAACQPISPKVKLREKQPTQIQQNTKTLREAMALNRMLSRLNSNN